MRGTIDESHASLGRGGGIEAEQREDAVHVDEQQWAA
jgi:hypothetical protein